MESQGSVDAPQASGTNVPMNNMLTMWNNPPAAPLSPTRPPVMMPPMLFSPTASSNSVFSNQQVPMVFSPIFLRGASPMPSPDPGIPGQQQQFFSSNTGNSQVFATTFPTSQGETTTASFSIQPIPGICISSPINSNNNLTFDTAAESNAPMSCQRVLTTPQTPPQNTGTAITGFFSPTGAQNTYYLQQRFQNLFLSPGDAMDMHFPEMNQLQAVSSPTPQQEYYQYASSMANSGNYSRSNGSYQNCNQSYNNNNYRNNNHNYKKKTYNVLPKRKLQFSQKHSNSTKRDAVISCLTKLEETFKEKIDDAGFRGPTALRIRVKTWNAIKHIVPFLSQANKEVKISKVSFPKSTKGLGKVLRGFLAYMLVEDLEERTKMQKLFDLYQQQHDSPFKKLEITVK